VANGREQGPTLSRVPKTVWREILVWYSEGNRVKLPHDYEIKGCNLDFRGKLNGLTLKQIHIDSIVNALLPHRFNLPDSLTVEREDQLYAFLRERSGLWCHKHLCLVPSGTCARIFLEDKDDLLMLKLWWEQ
jgi:hypothetical protein